METDTNTRINLKESEYDQDTYIGRVKHFVKLTNPVNVFLTDSQLSDAERIVKNHQQGELKVPIYIKVVFVKCDDSSEKDPSRSCIQ